MNDFAKHEIRNLANDWATKQWNTRWKNVGHGAPSTMDLAEAYESAFNEHLDTIKILLDDIRIYKYRLGEE